MNEPSAPEIPTEAVASDIDGLAFDQALTELDAAKGGSR